MMDISMGALALLKQQELLREAAKRQRHAPSRHERSPGRHGLRRFTRG
jgi:hypothetical protein